MTEPTDDDADAPETSEFRAEDWPWIWCLVANVTREPHPEGDPPEMRLGTRHFAPGAKLYLIRTGWGDGGEKMHAIGRHRGGGARLFGIVMGTKWLVNWRCRKVFDRYVINAMECHAFPWDGSEESRVEIEGIAEARNNGRMADAD